MANAKQAALISLFFKYQGEEQIVEMLEDLGLKIRTPGVVEKLLEAGHLVPYVSKNGEGLAAASQLARKLETKLEDELWREYWGRR